MQYVKNVYAIPKACYSVSVLLCSNLKARLFEQEMFCKSNG